MKKTKLVTLALTVATILSGYSVSTAATYTEYEMYVKRPSNFAGNTYYTGAKYEPVTGAYLGLFAEGDRAVHDWNVDSWGWYFTNVPKVMGKDHAMYMLYMPYSYDFNHYKSHYAEAKRLGKGMQICIEPQNGLDEVQNDGKLLKMAQDARDTDIPIFLRFANEFNDNANAWHKDGPQKYIEKFRLVADVMHKNAPNVVMCWCPNDWPIASEHAYYPGDQYVDWVGVSSYPPYNSSKQPWQGNTWLDRFREVYDSYSAKKPIYISEGAPMANAEHAYHVDTTDLAKLEISRFYASAKKKYPRLKAIFYWDNNQELGGGNIRHYKLSDNPPTLSAYKNAIKDEYYLSSMNTQSKNYYQLIKSVKMNPNKEVVTSLVNDVKNNISKVDYYINGKFAGQGTFPEYDASIDFTNFKGKSITLSADYFNSVGKKVKNISYKIQVKN